MRAIALSTRYIARASAAATSRAASSEATLNRSSLQTVNGLEELWETMEEGGHSVYFSDRVTRKLAAMEKDQAEWVGEAEDEIIVGVLGKVVEDVLALLEPEGLEPAGGPVACAWNKQAHRAPGAERV